MRRRFVSGVRSTAWGAARESESTRRPAQDARVRENIHAAAYGSSPLGAPLLCPPSQLHTLSPKTLADFRALITQPQSLVVAGAGVGHDELIALAEKHFEPHLPPQMTRPPVVQSPYVGGCVLAEERAPTPSGYAVEATPQVRIACAMRAPEGGWHSKDLIACCVLQTLLGGGDSFSAGGPGKGMCDLGVPRCCGAFTPSTRLVSIRRGRGWFIFLF